MSMSGLVKGALSLTVDAANSAGKGDDDQKKKKKKQMSGLIHSVFGTYTQRLSAAARPLETFRKFDADESGTITRDEFLGV